MFDFLKKKAEELNPLQPKKPLLFTQEVLLDPADNDVLSEGCQMMFLKKDGSAYAGKKYCGKVFKPCWDYITGFCTPDQMKRISFNKFEIEVRGDADMSLVFPDPHDKPYIYRCGHTYLYPHLLPNTEYFCSLDDHEDHFDIKVDGKLIGTIEEREKRDRLTKLRGMLAKGYQATAQIDPSAGSCGIFLVVRKV